MDDAGLQLVFPLSEPVHHWRDWTGSVSQPRLPFAGEPVLSAKRSAKRLQRPIEASALKISYQYQNAPASRSVFGLVYSLLRIEFNESFDRFFSEQTVGNIALHFWIFKLFECLWVVGILFAIEFYVVGQFFTRGLDLLYFR